MQSEIPFQRYNPTSGLGGLQSLLARWTANGRLQVRGDLRPAAVQNKGRLYIHPMQTNHTYIYINVQLQGVKIWLSSLEDNMGRIRIYNKRIQVLHVFPL